MSSTVNSVVYRPSMLSISSQINWIQLPLTP